MRSAASLMSTKASIVIVTRNRREEALKAISSSLQQEYQPLEVLVYDDASTDGTSDAISERFPQVRLFRSPQRRGLGDPRTADLGTFWPRGRAALKLDPRGRNAVAALGLGA